MTIEQDDGTQVLHLQYQRGDAAAAGVSPLHPMEFAYPTLRHHGAVQLGWPPAAPPGPGTESLTQEMYAEITFRSTNATLNQGRFQIPFTWWQMGLSTAATNQAQGVEIDYVEMQSNTNSGGGWNNGTGMREWGCSSCNWPSRDIPLVTNNTHYHKFGVLVTSDRKTNFAKCIFLDDVFRGCQTLAPSDPLAFQNDRSRFPSYIVLWVGGNDPDNEVANPVDIYVKSITIFECGTYRTTTCPGTSYYDNNGLTYWH